MIHCRFLLLLFTFAFYATINMAVLASPYNSTVGDDTYFRELKIKTKHMSVGSYQIVIDTSRSLHITSPRYLSVAIDSDQIKWKMRGFDFDSEKLHNIAAALSPANIRWGGTMADFLHFNPNAAETPLPRDWTEEMREREHMFDSGFDPIVFKRTASNFTMPGTLWDKITKFCNEVGWDLMFDFNLFYWRNGLWDPSNADTLLRYSASRGVNIPAFQLGNEPNAYRYNFNFSVESDVLVKDFLLLKRLISRYPQYDASGLYGPDITNLANHGSSRQYLQGFLKAGGCDVVTEIALHHYYLSARIAKVKDFVNPDILDSLKAELDIANNITYEVCRFHKPIRLTETSSCYGGGAPDISDAYVAGFMWLDKLGLSAKYRVSHVFRQTFFEGSYSLIDMKLNPNPDYYLSLLYKRLVEGPVFHVITSHKTPFLRVYAHCARKDFYKYPDGAIVLYFLNLGGNSVTFGMGEYQNSGLDLFLLTPGDNMGLKSRFVKLNGQTLLLNGPHLPKLPPRVHTGDVTVSALSFGFIVIPSANVHLCNVYHASKVSEKH